MQDFEFNNGAVQLSNGGFQLSGADGGVGGEIVHETLGRQMSAEVDMQVTTAKRYPRSIDAFRKTAMGLATIDEETARACTYTIPRAGKHITGPSIRFMEIVASAWGNMREEKRSLEPEATVIRGQATVWDMERNRLVRAEVARRITDRNGARFNEDMITVTGNAAASIAHRNALKACIPEGYWKKIHEQVQEVGSGGKKTLAEKRAQWLDHWKRNGIDQERVLDSLGVPGVDDIGMGELATMQGLYTAIKAGDTTLDQAFPALADSPVPGSNRFGFARRREEAKQAQAQNQSGPQVNGQMQAQAQAQPQPSPQTPPAARPSSTQWINSVLAMNGRDAVRAIDAACNDKHLLSELAKLEGRKGVSQHIASILQATATAEQPRNATWSDPQRSIELVRQATTLQQLLEIEDGEKDPAVLDAIARRCVEIGESTAPAPRQEQDPEATQPQAAVAAPVGAVLPQPEDREEDPWARYRQRGPVATEGAKG